MTTETDTGVPPVPVCRWVLDCEEPGRNVVDVQAAGFKVNACDPHAEPHAQWAKRIADREECGEVLLTAPEEEPTPDCECPDDIRRMSAQRRREKVPYCPRCGTEEQRGRGEWNE